MPAQTNHLPDGPVLAATGANRRISPAVGYISLLPMIFFDLLLPSGSHAVVREVTFFPDSARVLETANIQLQCQNNEKCQAKIILLPLADPESLVVSLPAGSRIKTEDLEVKQIPRQDNVRIAEIRKQIAKLRDERKELQARLQGLEMQIQFWQLQTKAKTKNIA